MRTQWLTESAGLAGFVYLGLNYAVLPVILPALGISSVSADLLDQLQAMERGGLKFLNRSTRTTT